MNNTESNAIPPLDYMNGNKLMATHFDPLEYTIEKLLPQGIFILAGSGKIGKSWLALDICLSIATGVDFWGYKTIGTETLYLALEDNYRRLQSRMLEVVEETETDFEKVNFAIASRGISNGLIEQVNQFMAIFPKTKLIVIDTLEHIRNTKTETSMYSHDYNDIQTIRAITEVHNVTVLLIHHTRKMFDPDPLNTLTGSTGLVGAVDGVWILEKERRTENKGKLTIINRDTDGYCFKVEFDKENFKWNNLGDYETSTKQEDNFCDLINSFLKNNWQGTATELVKILGDETITATSITKKLNKRKEQLKADYGIDYFALRTGNQRTITLVRGDSMTNDSATIYPPSNDKSRG